MISSMNDTADNTSSAQQPEKRSGKGILKRVFSDFDNFAIMTLIVMALIIAIFSA